MTAVLIVSALIALVWGAIYVLRGQLLAGCLAFLLAGACFGHPFVHFDLGAVPLTLDRLVLLVLVVAYIVQRRLGRTDPKPLGWTDLLLGGLVGVLVLSTLLNDFRGGGPGTLSPLWRLIGGYVIPVVIYWIARQSPLERGKISLVHGGLACFGVYLAVTGIAEIAGQWWLVFPKYIADPTVGIHFGRARGPMIHSVSFGQYLAVCLLCLWVWQWRFARVGRLVLISLAPLLLAGIYFSYTRSVWMGAALGILIVLALTLHGSWRTLVIGGLVSAALLVAVTKMDSLLSFKRESTATAADTGKSVDMRASFAYVSWKMFLDRPILGFGFGQFPKAKLPYLADRSVDLKLESIRTYAHHNTLLSLLTETGMIGLALFLAVLIGWLRTAWTLYRNPRAPEWARMQGVLLIGVLAIYVCQLLFHELSYTPIDNSLVFFLAGLTVGTSNRRTRNFEGRSQGTSTLEIPCSTFEIPCSLT